MLVSQSVNETCLRDATGAHHLFLCTQSHEPLLNRRLHGAFPDCSAFTVPSFAPTDVVSLTPTDATVSTRGDPTPDGRGSPWGPGSIGTCSVQRLGRRTVALTVGFTDLRFSEVEPLPLFLR